MRLEKPIPLIEIGSFGIHAKGVDKTDGYNMKKVSRQALVAANVPLLFWVRITLYH